MFRYLISLAVAVALPAAAVVVDTSPGALASRVENPSRISELTVTGSVDARDLFFIADEMPSLKKLDLSGVSVAAYDGAPVKQLAHYEARELPTGIFAGSNLESVILGTDGIAVGEAAFAGSALKNISIPAACELSAGAFAACRQLTEAQLDVASIPDGAFSGCALLAKVTASEATGIGASAFANCIALRQFIHSDKLREIGASAFAGCTSLASFDFPASLLALGPSAFSGSGLAKAELGACTALDAVGDWAFSKCRALHTVTLPPQLKTLGKGLFFDCPQVGPLRIPVSCTTISDFALKGAGPSELSLPASVGHIGDYAMAGMPDLERLYVHQLISVPDLGKDVWAGVNQPAVALYVLDAMYSDFASADQWREFNFVEVASQEQIDLTPCRRVRGRFDGRTLTVDFGGLEAGMTLLHDVTGRLLVAVDSHGHTGETIDCSALTGRIFLITVALADGKTVSLKLAAD